MMSLKMKSVIPILLSAFVCVTHSLNYGDLENTGMSCPNRDSCEGYRGELSFWDRRCECDSDCFSYKDCCIDASRRKHPVRRLGQNNMKCHLYGEDSHTGVYLISDCSSSWKGPRQVREKCVGPPDLRDPLSAAPVTSENQRLTYRNVFCAACNNVNMDSLTVFQIRLRCEGTQELSEDQFLKDLTYNQHLGSWGVNRPNYDGNGTYFVGCKISFYVPKYLNEKIRFCRHNIISNCAPDWTSNGVKRSCEEYMAVVYDTNDIAFRNPHCAICNHRTVDQLSCTLKVVASMPPFSFVFLLDVNPSGGNKVGKEKCPPGHIRDPFFNNTCILPGCAKEEYKIVNGICVEG